LSILLVQIGSLYMSTTKTMSYSLVMIHGSKYLQLYTVFSTISSATYISCFLPLRVHPWSYIVAHSLSLFAGNSSTASDASGSYHHLKYSRWVRVACMSWPTASKQTSRITTILDVSANQNKAVLD
jgi:hypothetical protein